MTTYTIATCSSDGCRPSMLAPGMAAIFVRMVFCQPTIYINRYASEGTTITASDSMMISVAAGTTIKFVSRKHTEKRPK